MPRASWRGFLRLSLVSCPIYLSPATTRAKSIRLHQVWQPAPVDHQGCHRRRGAAVPMAQNPAALHPDRTKRPRPHRRSPRQLRDHAAEARPGGGGVLVSAASPPPPYDFPNWTKPPLLLLGGG